MRPSLWLVALCFSYLVLIACYCCLSSICYLSKHKEVGFYSDVMKTPAFSAGGNATELGASLREAFLAFDTRLKPICAAAEDRSGATGTTALVTETHIICGNAGDSRTVLGRAGKAIPLSKDHKPDDLPEKTRIEAAGGSVMMNRVNGDLAVSRALGDFTYKANDEVVSYSVCYECYMSVMIHVCYIL